MAPAWGQPHSPHAQLPTCLGIPSHRTTRRQVRLREYQDELGRRTDGSLLQELVEAKVRACAKCALRHGGWGMCGMVWAPNMKTECP